MIIAEGGRLKVCLLEGSVIDALIRSQYRVIEDVIDCKSERERVLYKWSHDEYFRVRLSHIGEDVYTETPIDQADRRTEE